jgi:hypothetical protein
MWADDYCSVKREYCQKTGRVLFYIFTGNCVVTKKEYSVRVPGPELFAYRNGKFIQDAMPSVSRDDREFLISGMSPEGWEENFKDE